MVKIRLILSFIKTLYSELGKSYIWVYSLGLINSFIQGIGILLIIPIIQSYNNDNDGMIFKYFESHGFKIELHHLLILFLVIMLCLGVFKGAYAYYSNKIIASYSKNYLSKAFSTIIKSKWSLFSEVSSSEFINLFKTEGSSVKQLVRIHFSWLQQFTSLVIYIALAAFLSFKLTFLIIGILLILVITQNSFFKSNFKLGKDKILFFERLQLILNETFGSIKVLKLYSKETRQIEKYDDVIQGVYENDLKKAKTDALSEFVYTFASAVVIIGIVFYSLKSDQIDIGALIVLLILLSRIINQSKAVVKSTMTISHLLPSFNHFNAVLKITNKHQVNAIPLSFKEPLQIKLLSLKGVSFSYKKKVILHNQDFNFELNNLYLLTGDNGIGKTTTLDLISGLLSFTDGEYYLNENRASKEQIKAIQNEISYVLQDVFLFEGSILENITFGEVYSKEHIESVINEAGLKTLVTKLPFGIDTMVKEGGKGLSGGEKQRINIARALIRNSKIILFDEITNSLDAQNEELILQTIQNIKQNRIIIMVTHDQTLHKFADEVIHLS